MQLAMSGKYLVLEGRQALWLSEQPCLPQEVSGESFNALHIEGIVQRCQGQLGVPLVAWLSPEATNPHDSNAVVVWIGGGKAGYLPRTEAAHWQRIIIQLQHQSRHPIACGAHIELPPEVGTETGYQCILWLPPVPWQTAHPLTGPDVAKYMARANAEPAARAERARLKEQQRQAAAAQKLAKLVASYGEEAAKRIILGEPWQGATEPMIIEALGTPEKIEEKVLKTKTKKIFSYIDECTKCAGSGFLPEFVHIDDGKCFICNGRGRSRGITLRVIIENGIVIGWEKK